MAQFDWLKLATNQPPQQQLAPSLLLDPEAQFAAEQGMPMPQMPAQAPNGPMVQRSMPRQPSYAQQFDDAFKGSMDDRKTMLEKLQAKMAEEEGNVPSGLQALNLKPFMAFADSLAGTNSSAHYTAPTAKLEHQAKLAKLQEQVSDGSDKIADDQLAYLKMKATEEMARNRMYNSNERGDSNDEHKIRTQYLNNPIIKDFTDVDAAFSTIETNPGLTGPDQEAFVVQFNKLLDPGSVVREGEFFRSAANAGKINQMMQLVEKWKTGKGLTPEQVADMKTVAAKIRASYRQKVNQLNADYEGLARRKGYDPRNIVLDNYRDKPKVGGKQPNSGNGPQIGTVEDGYRYKGGPVNNPSSWEQVK
jgi:hypothetical protein